MEVTICATVHGALIGHAVKQKVKEAGARRTKRIPDSGAVTDSNQNMGGVDLSLIAYYSLSHKTMK